MRRTMPERMRFRAVRTSSATPPSAVTPPRRSWGAPPGRYGTARSARGRRCRYRFRGEPRQRLLPLSVLPSSPSCHAFPETGTSINLLPQPGDPKGEHALAVHVLTRWVEGNPRKNFHKHLVRRRFLSICFLRAAEVGFNRRVSRREACTPSSVRRALSRANRLPRRPLAPSSDAGSADRRRPPSPRGRRRV